MKVNYNAINRRTISPANRIDAEFFSEKFIELESNISVNNFKSFSDLCSENDIKVDPTKEPDRYFSYIEITDIDLADGAFYPQYVLGEEAPSRARKVCKEDQLIISTVRPNRNAVALIPKIKDRFVCSTGFCVFDSKHCLEPESIFIFLKSKYAKIQLTRRMRATMYPAVANIDILEIKAPIPSKRLRSKIIKGICDAHLLRQESHKKIEEINKFVKDFCNDVLSGLNIEKYDNENKVKIINREDIFSGANRIDSEFYRKLHDKISQLLNKYGVVQPLEYFYNKIFTGNTPAKGDYRDPEEEGIPIIKVGTLTNTGLNWSDIEFASIEFFDKNKEALVKPNDILLTSSAHSSEHICKKVDVVNAIPKQFNNECLFVGELLLLRNETHHEIEPYFVASFLRSELGIIQVQRCVRGISSHIYPIDIKKYVMVPIPKPTLISKISTLAQDAERKKNEAIDIIRTLVEEYENEVAIDF